MKHAIIRLQEELRALETGLLDVLARPQEHGGQFAAWRLADELRREAAEVREAVELLKGADAARRPRQMARAA